MLSSLFPLCHFSSHVNTFLFLHQLKVAPSDIGLRQEKEEALFQKNCPHCYSENVKIHSHYQTKGNGERKMFICQECSSCFAETYGSVIAGLETPLSEIIRLYRTYEVKLDYKTSIKFMGSLCYNCCNPFSEMVLKHNIKFWIFSKSILLPFSYHCILIKLTYAF